MMADNRNILIKPLKISDLDVVLEKLLEAQNSSYQLGLKFKLDLHALDAIHVREDVAQRCLMRVLREILNQEEPPPTWKLFIEALRSKLINLPRLATQLETELLSLKTTCADYQETVEVNSPRNHQKKMILISRDGSEGIPPRETAMNMEDQVQDRNPWNIIKSQREQIEDMQKVQRELRQSNEQQSKEISAMKQKLQADRDQIVEAQMCQSETSHQNYLLQANIHAMEMELNKLRTQLQQTTEEMQHQLTNKDITIRDLNASLQTAKEETKSQMITIQKKSEEEERSCSLEATLHQKVGVLEQQLDQRNQEIRELTSQLNTTRGAIQVQKSFYETSLQQIKKENDTQESIFKDSLKEKEREVDRLQVALDRANGVHALHLPEPIGHNGRNAPEKMFRGATAVHEKVAYLQSINSNETYAYHNDSGMETWMKLPPNPNLNSGLTVIEGLLTSVGGEVAGKSTENLLSLKKEGGILDWQVIFPSMPTGRSRVACVTTTDALVVAGGSAQGRQLDTVEVLDFGSLKWSAVCPLPQPWSDISATSCQGNIYLAGGSFGSTTFKTLITCPLTSLTSWCTACSKNVWEEISSPPVTHSTLSSFNGYLVCVGGWNPLKIPTAEITVYNPVSNSWSVLTYMTMRRSMCLAFTLTSGELVVIGGRNRSSDPTNSVEIFEPRASV